MIFTLRMTDGTWFEIEDSNQPAQESVEIEADSYEQACARALALLKFEVTEGKPS